MYKLCILTSHFYPVKSSCSSLFKDLIKSLLSEDYHITIFTLSGMANKIKVINTKKIHYVGIKNKYLKSKYNYLRAFGEIYSILKLKYFYTKNKFPLFDQVIVYSPTIFWSIFLFSLKRKLLTIKLADLYPKWLVDLKIISRFSFNYYFLKFFELLLYSQSNRIFVQTKKDIDYLLKYKNIFNFSSDVIYNWINTFNYPIKKIKRKKKAYIRFVFIGVIGLAQDYKLLFKIIKYCNDNNFKFVFYFIGSGSYKNDLIKLTSRYKNVFFFPEKNELFLDRIVQKCDICVSTLNKNFFSENFPGRVLRYMKNNRPILVHSSNNNFLSNLIKKYDLGFYSSEEKDLYTNLNLIFSNPKLLESKGNRGIEVIKKFFSCEVSKKKLFNG